MQQTGTACRGEKHRPRVKRRPLSRLLVARHRVVVVGRLLQHLNRGKRQWKWKTAKG